MNIHQIWKEICKIKRLLSSHTHESSDHTHPDKTFSFYVYDKTWAEENAAISGNQQEWSFGNGSTGSVGLPYIENGWEESQLDEIIKSLESETNNDRVVSYLCKSYYKMNGIYPVSNEFDINDLGFSNVEKAEIEKSLKK